MKIIGGNIKARPGPHYKYPNHNEPRSFAESKVGFCVVAAS